jgi:excisionase family DNA binding protein
VIEFMLANSVKPPGNPIPLEAPPMPQIMTTKEVAEYLRLHEITICKYAAEGKIPAIRIGRVWRFDKEAVDALIGGDQNLGKG